MMFAKAARKMHLLGQGVTRQQSISLKGGTIEVLQQLSSETGKPMSWFVQKALHNFLEEELYAATFSQE